MVIVFLSYPFHSVTFSCLPQNNILSFFNNKRYNGKVTATNKRIIMAFDEILTNSTGEEIKQNSLLVQATKRREYNRQYQAKLRQTAKQLTLEKKIDANLDHVLGYIKTRYNKEYAAWVKPVKVIVFSNSFFDNWVLLSASEYKSVKEAFELSGLKDHMTTKEFTKLFEQYYKKNNSGRFSKD